MMKIISVFFGLMLSLGLYAQDGQRYTEADVALQGQFVTAAQKKILRKYDDAITIYESILEKDMHNSIALYDLSRIYLLQRKEEKAIEYAEKALKKDPKNEWYQQSLAEIYSIYKQHEKSAQLYEKLFQNHKVKEDYYLKAVDEYIALEDNKGAIRVLQKMEAQLGPSAYTSEQIIGFHLNDSNYEEAIAKSKEIVIRYPNDPYFVVLAAELEKDFGDKKKAKNLFERAIELDPENSRALVFLASQKKNRGGHLDNTRSIISNKNVDIDAKIKALIPLAEKITAESDDKDEVIALAKSVVDLHPEEAKGYALLGDMHKNSGDVNSAISAYSNAIDLDKSVFPIWQELMVLLYESEDFDGLAATSTKAIDFYPNQSLPYAFSGLAAAHTENIDKAKEMLMEAQFIGSKDPMVEAVTKLLEANVTAVEEGYEIKTMSNQDAFILGIRPDDQNVLYVKPDGDLVVKVKKGS